MMRSRTIITNCHSVELNQIHNGVEISMECLVFKARQSSINIKQILFCGILASILFFGSEPKRVFAQDRITIQKPGSNGRTRQTGEIIEFKGNTLTLRYKFGGKTTTFDANHIKNIETFQSTFYSNALNEMKLKKFSKAAVNLKKAIQEEPRQWMKREMLSSLVECQVNLKNRSKAGTAFLAMTRSDPETRHYGRIPLLWRIPKQEKSLLSKELKENAKEWMSRKDDSAQLLGASCLLFEPQFSETAERKLRSLSANPSSIIRKLAQLQRLRSIIANKNPRLLEFEDWKKKVKEIPDNLRGGPDLLLAIAATKRGDSQTAVESYLWIFLVFKRDRPLAAEAGFQTARAYEKMGQYRQAVDLYAEIVKEYPESEFAKKSMQELKNYSQPK